MTDTDFLDRAIVARVPMIIKARTPEASGRRIVECEVSNEAVDYDGDVVLQEALLNSAENFIARGHLDLDHKSEFGARLGIPDPASYIVGRPLDVSVKSGKRTFVEGEIARSRDGSIRPDLYRYDEFWASLLHDPPVVWYSSIYGFPTDFDDCTQKSCRGTDATRYVIKSLDWRSLAFTLTPANTALTGEVRIVTAKAYLAELAKSMLSESPPAVPLPNTMADVWKNRVCAKCQAHENPSLLGYRDHFAKCLSMPAGAADIMAHAAMHRERMRPFMPATA